MVKSLVAAMVIAFNTGPAHHEAATPIADTSLLFLLRSSQDRQRRRWSELVSVAFRSSELVSVADFPVTGLTFTPAVAAAAASSSTLSAACSTYLHLSSGNPLKPICRISVAGDLAFSPSFHCDGALTSRRASSASSAPQARSGRRPPQALLIANRYPP